MNRLRSNAIRVSFACATALWLLAPTSARASFIAGPRSVGAFQSEDDGRCHAVVAQTSGGIVDVTYDCRSSTVLSTTVLARINGPVAIAGYYSPNDQFRHAMVGTAAGDLFDVRYKPNLAPAPIRLTNIHGYGPIKSLAAWTDSHNRQNLAILTTWLNAQVASVWQAAPGQVGDMHYLAMYPGNDYIDIAGEYIIWDDTNKIQLAHGSPSAMQMISWHSSIVPDQWNIDVDFAGTNTPWVTDFPANADAPETIVSMGANGGFFSDYTPWSGTGTIVTGFIDSNNAIKIFRAVNGGGTMAPGSLQLGNSCSRFIRCIRAQSIAGPHFTDLRYGPIPRIQMVVALSDGRLQALSASQPGYPSASPSYDWISLGSF